jgi:phosphate transport system protein
MAVKSFLDRDTGLFGPVFADEKTVNALQVEIDREAIRLIAVYTPAAADLRFLLMVSRINSELERIGDQAINICGYTEKLAQEPAAEPLADIPEMAELAGGMVRGALEALAEKDPEKATAIRNSDDQVDDLNDNVFHEMLRHAADNPEHVQQAITQILAARALERIADHSTNICEEVVYLVLGDDIRHANG